MTANARSRARSTPVTRTSLLRRAALGAAMAGLAMVAATPVFAQDRTVTCTNVTQAQVAGLFDRWNASLATLDPDQVVANYAPDGVLLPTVNNGPLTTPAEIRGYFVKFLKNAPHGTIDKRVIKIGCNSASDVGTYTFKFKDGSSVKARYTYDYTFENGQWLIAHHHSSKLPETK